MHYRHDHGNRDFKRFEIYFPCFNRSCHQTYHALRGADGSRAAEIASILAALLEPGGRLLVVAGNANEPARTVPGPSLLTREELVDPFTTACARSARGGETESCLPLRLVSCRETRFDATRHYGQQGPLAWVAIFERS